MLAVMGQDNPAVELECVSELPRAAVLLHPLRLKILRSFDQPKSATDVAGELRMSRQQVNYHVQRLARARFLRKAGRRQKRGLRDQCFVQNAKSLLVLPQVLGPLAPSPAATRSALSAAYLLALSAVVQKELGVALSEATAAQQTVATLAIDAEVRFTSPDQRAQFTQALHAAVTDVIARHASPMRTESGDRAPGRPHRVVIGAYPIPAVFEP
ncbi:MAG: helix-turn-helix transcriptional regulator [Planctomycetes bacterium]|nr:helix-turn-helix transcriptional regulator [Planctomycetota bacterium]